MGSDVQMMTLPGKETRKRKEEALIQGIVQENGFRGMGPRRRDVAEGRG